MLKKKVVCVLAGLGLMAGATTAFGSSRASLFLVGQVEVIANIFVNPVLGSLDTLDVENGETDRLIATVDEETNNTTGYRIDMESVNTANLQHNDGTTNVAYTVKYDGALLAVAPGALGAQW